MAGEWFTTLLDGASSVKVVPRWGNIKVIPFVGFYGRGDSARIVAGLKCPIVASEIYWCPPLVSRAFITPWRVMKLFEKQDIHSICDGMIRALWHALGYDGAESEAYLDELARYLGGQDRLEALSAYGLSLVPSPKEIYIMTARLERHNVPFVDPQLIEEVKAGRIIPTKSMRGMISRMEERMRAA